MRQLKKQPSVLWRDTLQNISVDKSEGAINIAQFYAPHRGEQSAVHKLYLAVFESAIHDQDRAWFEDADNADCNFSTFCELFNLDLHAAQLAILSTFASSLSTHNCSKRYPDVPGYSYNHVYGSCNNSKRCAQCGHRRMIAANNSRDQPNHRYTIYENIKAWHKRARKQWRERRRRLACGR